MNCILCISTITTPPEFSVSDRLGMDSRDFAVHRCAACRSIMIDPLPSENEIKALYPAHYNFSLREGEKGLTSIIKRLEWLLLFRRSYERSYRMIARAIGRKTFKVLDVGCGSGLRLAIFKDHGCAVSGNDIAPACIDYMKNTLHIDAWLGKLETLSLEPRSFDAVCMFALFEHLPFPEKTITAARNLLGKNGVLVIQTPVVDTIQFSLLGRKAAMIKDMPRHLFIPSREGLRAFMKRLGFDLYYSTPVSLLEIASLFSLGVYGGASTPTAYASTGLAAALRRLAGWAITLFPGIPVALLERIIGTGIENIYIFKRSDTAHETK